MQKNSLMHKKQLVVAAWDKVHRIIVILRRNIIIMLRLLLLYPIMLRCVYVKTRMDPCEGPLQDKHGRYMFRNKPVALRRLLIKSHQGRNERPSTPWLMWRHWQSWRMKKPEEKQQQQQQSNSMTNKQPFGNNNNNNIRMRIQDREN